MDRVDDPRYVDVERVLEVRNLDLISLGEERLVQQALVFLPALALLFVRARRLQRVVPTLVEEEALGFDTADAQVAPHREIDQGCGDRFLAGRLV